MQLGDNLFKGYLLSIAEEDSCAGEENSLNLLFGLAAEIIH